jgi:hypothetical protein
MMIDKKWFFIACLALLLASNLFGQAESGSVVGVVTDQGGAVVPRATVTLLNEGTRFTRTVNTNENGQYTAYSFPTGRITVSVEHPGFQKLVRSGIQLTAADTLTVDLRLTVGNLQETIEVTGEAPLLQSQTAVVLCFSSDYHRSGSWRSVRTKRQRLSKLDEDGSRQQSKPTEEDRGQGWGWSRRGCPEA